ncbi:LAETG motif-containing sortase-dependent surface protein [Streptomyces sp. BPTC-684]|uniref:LAETG motif-containing sortase-dependent surface protein n=1 Tax=Streptomyces sp. BPTC-684 TaxID=3043734 RepID=UPI0024B119D1|nr:LAETG motif-containing sortase-dependent surface protein [Streptomyces sp. BPTC-684]WHM40144.1 LAETG motif-containing sortase-dependent surface protein [Streptomyces sp. BPTC-684]
MTVIRGTGRRRGALIGAAAAGLIGVGLTAVPAQAHTPVWKVTCSAVTVDLTRYSDEATNTVTIKTADGKDLLPTEQFKGEFHKNLKLPAHDKELTLHLIVKAGDGDQYSRDETKTSPVCDTVPPTKPTPSGKPSKPSKPTPTPSAKPSEPAPAPSTSAPAAPAPAPSPNLAETGSSSSTPLVAGMGGAVLVAGAGIVWAARRRRTARH